jgi:hypothetical protein
MSSVKSLINNKKYHGVQPPTKEDAKLARSHLDRTMSLEKQKIKEHKIQKSKAKKMGNKQSVNYNDSHIKKHKEDVAERQQSKKTINEIWDKLGSMRGNK